MAREDHRSPHVLYQIMRHCRNATDTRALLKMILWLSLPEKLYNKIPCVLCNKEYSDIICHVLTQCPSLNEGRNKLWDYILDSVDVYRGVSLSNMDDEKFVDIVCGAKWPGLYSLSKTEFEQLYIGIGKIINEHFMQSVYANYTWLH